MKLDPIHQFEIKNYFPVVNIGGYEIGFTNSALYMDMPERQRSMSR